MQIGNRRPLSGCFPRLPAVCAVLALLITSTAVLTSAARADTPNVWVSNGPGAQNLVQAIAIDPQFPDTLYAGTFPGTIYRSPNRGENWAEWAATLADVVRSVTINPDNPAVIYAGTRTKGVFRTANWGVAWDSVNVGLSPRQVNALLIDPSDTSRVFAGTIAGLFRSVDSGTSWNAAGLDSASVTGLSQDPLKPATLYAATDGHGVFRSPDGGDTWAQVNNGLGSLRVAALAVNPVRPTVLYAATFDAGVFRSTDGAETWRAINNGLTVLSVTSLAVAPSNPPVLYAGTSPSRVFKSSDSGGIWVDITGGLPQQTAVGALVVHPDSANVIYAGLSKVHRLKQIGLDGRLFLFATVQPSAMVSADFDGDGSFDAAVANLGDGTLSTFLNRGRGAFFVPQQFVAGGQPASLAAGDLDGDDDADLVVGNRSSRTLTAFFNDGAGAFSYGLDLFVGEAPAATALADIDRDGHLDILAASTASGSSISLFANSGQGDFFSQQVFACGADPAAMAVADLNGDGFLDVLTANRGDGSVSLLKNSGGARFSDPVAVSVGGAPVDVETGDFDLDGHTDAAVITGEGNRLVLLRNRGDGTLVVSKRRDLPFVPSSLRGADLDGDRYIDLAIAGDNRPVNLLANDGRGGFDGALQAFDGGHSARKLELADLDLDGDPDLLAVQADEGGLYIIRNDLPRDIKPPAPPRMPAAEDVQGDLGGRIRLTWHLPRADEETGRVASYRIFRATSMEAPFTQIREVSVDRPPVRTDSLKVYRAYTDSLVLVDAEYFYLLRAVGPNQEASGPSAVVSARSRAQPFFDFDFSGTGAYHVGDSIEVSVGLVPLDYAISGISLYLNYDPLALGLVDADPAEAGVQPFLPAESVREHVLENRLNGGLAGAVNYALGSSQTVLDTGRIDLGTLRFVARKDTSTAISVVDSPSANRRTAVVEQGVDGVVLPYLMSGRYVLDIHGVRISSRINLQGRDGSNSTLLRVDLRRSDGSSLPDSLYRPLNDLDQDPANGVQTRSDATGQFSLIQVPAGTYSIFVKSFHTLRGRVAGDSVSVSAAASSELRFYWKSSVGTVVNDTLRGGDANDDDRVNLSDFGTLASHFGARDVLADQPAWRADFNGDGIVDVGDFGILASNFGETGLGRSIAFKPASAPDIFALLPLSEGVYALMLTEPYPAAGFSVEIRPPEGTDLPIRVLAGEGVSGGDRRPHWIDREVAPGRIRVAAHVRAGEGVFPAGAELVRILTDGPPPILRDLLVIDPEGGLLAAGPAGRLDMAPDVPDRPALYQNAPNPFNPATAIRFDVSETADVTLRVYNLLGQEVRLLVRERMAPGAYSLVWDGTDRKGRPVASGVYLYRISIGAFRDIRKLLLLR